MPLYTRDEIIALKGLTGYGNAQVDAQKAVVEAMVLSILGKESFTEAETLMYKNQIASLIAIELNTELTDSQKATERGVIYNNITPITIVSIGGV